MAEQKPKNEDGAATLALYGVFAIIAALVCFYWQGKMDVLLGQFKISWTGWMLVGVALVMFARSFMKMIRRGGPPKAS